MEKCKIEDVGAKYELQPPESVAGSLDDYLVARWTGTRGHQSVGYRTLTEWFNKRLLKRVYDEHGRSTMGVRLESDYEVLTGDDDVVRDEVVADLDADGIDAEAVLDDMVSPRTMHRHLTGCLDAEKETRSSGTDWERESVEKARETLEEKVSKATSALASKGELDGESEIEIQVYLSCPHCTTRVPFEVARHQGYVCERHESETGRAVSNSD